ncbi:SdpA family antimicrobial peptide system protein [Rathayibacter iranicus]|uniref:Antimicrobial peptide system SdpA family protein n=1 Tax=Rathayibacter iranicus NCPPB 2253 = VKM Ac-1602 TaxID=1328868 RepID=A0ABX5LGD2_9MICO|nr:SdpA family antimicrobial peptide system protein [Rathayibacter iranicus NCPPB 2253 = VKM Ac-1602]PWJ66843.1 antimicrobial peptide system SdpA family protein [Rathayibacter iranicus NCPPB 2253 = VKM Ac-1602]
MVAGIVGLTLAFYVFQGAVSFRPSVLPPARNDVIQVTRQIAPQGWAFFTKDAQSDYLVPFEVSDNSLVNRSVDVSASAEWALGFNRMGRAQGAEIATFLQGVGQGAWTKCGTENACEAVAAGEPLRVHNPRNNPTLCGELLLVAQKPVPWEWRNLQAEARFHEAIFLDVAC